MPVFRSVYHWLGEQTLADEVLLVIWMRKARYSAPETAIIEQHPYELPEIVMVLIEDGFDQYQAWINEYTA